MKRDYLKFKLIHSELVERSFTFTKNLRKVTEVFKGVVECVLPDDSVFSIRFVYRQEEYMKFDVILIEECSPIFRDVELNYEDKPDWVSEDDWEDIPLKIELFIFYSADRGEIG